MSSGSNARLWQPSPSLALTGAAAAEVVYNRGNAGEPETLDVHKTSTVRESHILRDLYEGLVIHNAKGEVIPGAAEKWEISDDGKTLPLHAARRHQVVERRPGQGVRLRVLLPAHHEPGDRRQIRQHPLPDPERREGQQGPGEARGSRRQGGRRQHPRDQARAADPLLPRAADPPDRACRSIRARSRSSARTSSSPATWSRTAPTSSPSSCRTRTSSSSRTRTSTTPRTSRSTR